MCTKGRLFCFSVFIVIWIVSGCANLAVAPISSKSGVRQKPATVYRAGAPNGSAQKHKATTYVVRRGDTLHAIAWRFGVDFRALSRWNRLPNPNVIYEGQRLRLKPRPPSTTAPAKPATAKTRPRVTQRAKPKAPKKTVATRISWRWPARGEVQAASSALGSKGIEILGRRADPVVAAASGTVVYSGSGLRGYGRLIIIQHNEDYLSAYAHNDKLLVNEGATVNSGQRIADMGDSDAKRVMLHFEIRKDGKAVKPLQYLPRR